MDFRRVRHASEGARNQLNSVFIPAALMSKNAEHMQRVDLVRRAPQHLAVKAFGTLVPPRFVVFEAGLQVSRNLCLLARVILFVGCCHPRL